MERTSYVAIAKCRGFVYAYDNQLFRQEKKRGSVIYLKCCTDPCDGSAKIENGEVKLIVSTRLLYLFLDKVSVPVVKSITYCSPLSSLLISLSTIIASDRGDLTLAIIKLLIFRSAI